MTIDRAVLRYGVFLFLTATAVLLFSQAASAQWTQPSNSSNVYKTDTNGNVGIGTISPGYKLDVQSGSTGGWASSVFNTSNSGAVQMAHGAGFGMYIDPGSNAGAGTYALQIVKSGTSYVFVRGDGYVGIGTTNPQYKLDVAGNINSSATITGNNIVAKYQDVAEWVASSERLATGTVVVLDSTKSNQVVASTTAYDTRVAGVISAQPGITLGEKSDSKVLVATTGRVRVRVDASRGPIAIGDLLVTSDVPGVAMKSIPVEFAGRKMHMPGTIIGKALEPLAKGKGEVLVLLSLQ